MSDIALEKIDDKLIFHDDKKDKTSLQEGPIETINDKIIDNISNYNNEIYNSQMKIRPLIKRINRRF